jgi:hypothetical protein
MKRKEISSRAETKNCKKAAIEFFYVTLFYYISTVIKTNITYAKSIRIIRTTKKLNR